MINWVGWNNARRSTSYWISLGILLWIAYNYVIFGDIWKHLILSHVYDVLCQIFESFFPPYIYYGSYYSLFAILVMVASSVLIIICINSIMGFLDNWAPLENTFLFSFIFKPPVLMDVFIGFIIEVQSLGVLSDIRRDDGISLIYILYFLLFLLGTVLYWNSTFPIIKYVNFYRSFKKKLLPNTKTWLCISNCDYRFSTFSRIPFANNYSIILLDTIDIQHLSNTSLGDFYNYLFVADMDKPITSEFKDSYTKIIRIPHSRVAFFEIGQPSKETQKELNNLIINNKEAIIREYKHNNYLKHENVFKHIHELHLKTPKKRNPHYYITEKLGGAYEEIIQCSTISLRFFKTIMNDLNIIQSIYALYDWIDLQYRIVIAVTYNPAFSWMDEFNIKAIGNIITMASFKKVEDRIKENIHNGSFSIDYSDLTNNILSDSDYSLLRKYWPNYKIDTNYLISDTIIFITAMTRNIFRGHGTVQGSDASRAFELVLKLALLNACLLQSFNIKIEKMRTLHKSYTKSPQGFKNVMTSSRLLPLLR